MNSLLFLAYQGVRVAGPLEEGAEREVLDHGELGEDFCVVHFEHALRHGVLK